MFLFSIQAINTVDLNFIPGIMDDVTQILNSLVEMLMGKVPNFLLEIMKEIIDFLEQMKGFAIKELLNQAANIKNSIEKLTQLETLVTNLADKKNM